MLNYVLQGSFTFLTDSIFDELPDGRLIAWDGKSVQEEDAPRSRRFHEITKIQAQFPSFLRVSPSGERVAVGDGQVVTVFRRDSPASQKKVTVENYDAEWIDEERLAASGYATDSHVSILNLTTGQSTVVVRDIGDASGGVTIDNAYNLYCGDGLDKLNPRATGSVKAFARADWDAVLSGGAPIDFRKQGTLVADLLSAAYLGFDGVGNLHVGGGNTFGQFPAVGYAAVVSSDAVASALVGGLPAVPCAPFRDVLELDPEPANRFWYVSSNWVTGELYLTAYGETKVFVYGPLRGLSQAG